MTKVLETKVKLEMTFDESLDLAFLLKNIDARDVCKNSSHRFKKDEIESVIDTSEALICRLDAILSSFFVKIGEIRLKARPDSSIITERSKTL